MWLVHIDESGFSQKPSIRRTWSPRGVTPILKAPCNWQRLSALGALAVAPDRQRVRAFLALHPGNVRGERVVSFLRGLRRHLRGRVLVVWDRLACHRSAETRRYLAANKHWLEIELLPAYAPELNPVEYLWSYLKGKDMTNFAPDDLSSLARQVRRKARRVRNDTDLLWGFLKHSTLYP